MPEFYKEFPKTTAMPRALVPLFLAAGVIAFALTLVAFIAKVDPESTLQAALSRGDILPVLMTAGFWRSLPTMPESFAFAFDLPAAAVIFGLLFFGFGIVRRGFRRSWSAVGYWVVAWTMLPVLLGALSSLKLVPYSFGSWLDNTVAALLLGGIACGLCGVLDIARPNLPAARKSKRVPRRRLSKSPLSIRSVVPADRRTG